MRTGRAFEGYPFTFITSHHYGGYAEHGGGTEDFAGRRGRKEQGRPPR